ncbi:MAG: PspC domain-containing protein [Spirochaetaceae bacterium]
MSTKKLTRSSRSCVFAGVCGGLAEYFNIDPLIIRILFIVSGIGIIPYILMAIFIPQD